ncbi:MAG TPA: peptidylprolyl isomerase [Bacteroidia bacterium]
MSAFAVKAQQNLIIDEVIAVVGNKPILRSDLDKMIAQVDPELPVTEKMKCDLLKELIIEKMMLHQSEIDSLVVTDDDVNDRIDNNIRFIERNMRSGEKLEKYLGMSVAEYKKMIFPKVKNQILRQKMEQKLQSEIKITPKEVRDYYNKIPVDSLPFMSAEVEVAQIVFKPKYSREALEIAKEHITELRNRVLKGESFAKLAALHSEDPGSKKQGGMLPEFGRGDMVAEFERAAFLLKKDSISDIIETKFGFHVLYLVNRRGEKLLVRHILIRPRLIDSDLEMTKKTADSVLNLLKAGKMKFCDAVKMYSEDEETSPNCGFFTDPNIGSQRIPFDYLDRDMATYLSSMKEGEFSEPQIAYSADGSEYFRILYLKQEVKPHVANLDLDWQRIQSLAIDAKKVNVLDQWAEKKRKETYIFIKDSYLSCGFFNEWITKN